jgi:tetratricopeptide (TPR) repeat protein
VRIEAAGALIGQDLRELSAATRSAFTAALAEYTAAQEYVADRAEGLSALANLRRVDGDVAGAEALLQEALERDPTFSGAYLNLADLYRATGREPAATELLERGLERAADRALLHFALGLSYIRGARKPEALRQLESAHRLGPGVARYAYVYAVSLHDAGRPRPALDVLREALRRAPGDAELLRAALEYSREAGLAAEAASYATRLAESSAAAPPAPP